MPLPENPPRNPESPFASMRGHHVAIRYPDYEKARAFWVDTMGWRVLQVWPFGNLTLTYVMPPTQDDFHLARADVLRTDQAAVHGTGVVGGMVRGHVPGAYEITVGRGILHGCSPLPGF